MVYQYGMTNSGLSLYCASHKGSIPSLIMEQYITFLTESTYSIHTTSYANFINAHAQGEYSYFTARAMKTLALLLCMLALTSSTVLSLSARNAQVMATLEQLESLLNSQLLSEAVQEQDYNEMAAKEELIAAIQRACNRGSGAHVQSLSTLADLLSRDEVTTQEAMNIIQAQGLYDLIEEQSFTASPPVDKVIKKVAEKKIEEEIEKEVKKETEKEVEKEIAKEILTSPKLREILETGVTIAPPVQRVLGKAGVKTNPLQNKVIDELKKKIIKDAVKPGSLGILRKLSELVGLLD